MNKSKFSHDIIPCKIHSDGRKYPYEITENMWYKWDGVEGKIQPTIIVVPKGYFTDLVSSPWVVQWAVKPNGIAAMPAIYHDVGCSTEYANVRYVNNIMNAAMIDWGIRAGLRLPIYYGIYTFCWLTYKKHIKKEVKEDRELVLKATEEVWKEYGKLFNGYAKMKF